MSADASPSGSAGDAGRTAHLARLVRSGDRSRFEELYARVAPSLYAWLRLRAPRGTDPADLLGEVWLRALRRLGTHEAEDHEFRAWIFGIAKNVVLQWMRSTGNSRSVGHGDAGAGAGVDSIPESITSIGSRLAGEDALVKFLEYAQSLDPRDRDLLVHCGLEGLSCVDVATRLGIGAEAATKRWQRLRTDLRSREWIRDLLSEAG